MLTFGVVFLFLQRTGQASARYWGIGYLSAAFAFATPLVLGGLPFEVQAILSNLLFFSAFFLYGHALLTHFGRPLYTKARLSIVVVAVLLVSFHVFITPDLKRELVIGDLVCALLLAIPVWLVRKRPAALADRLMVGIACLVVVETLVRIGLLLVMTPGGSMIELSEFFESDYAFYMQLAASIFGFLLALSVLASQISVTVDRHQHAAEHDPLTDVLNRRGFDRRVPDFRNDTPDGAVIACDIDHFKRINDVYGHAAGDIVLIGLSDLLTKCARGCAGSAFRRRGIRGVPARSDGCCGQPACQWHADRPVVTGLAEPGCDQSDHGELRCFGGREGRSFHSRRHQAC